MEDSESYAERYLLDLIRSGDADGWAQFVDRYQGRMVAFAHSQIRQLADAEDVVQETLIGFIRSLDRFQQDATLETWLFRILRRRIVDYFRQRGKRQELPACALRATDDSQIGNPIDQAVAAEDTPSVRFTFEEQQVGDDRALSAALHEVVNRMKRDQNLRDLQIMEGLFFAGISNRHLSGLLDLSEGNIAVVRHRLIKRLAKQLPPGSHEEESAPASDLLSRIWERDRPSCPKRTTLGKATIGLLDDSWQQYVDFHVETLGCQYCRANVDDLRNADTSAADSAVSERIFHSTVGFISRPE